MGTPFMHTLRSVEVDASTGGRALLLLAPLLLAAWTTWLFAARVEVTQLSEDARVQGAAVIRELAAARAGRVAKVHVELGDRVAAGALLVELDDADTVQARVHAMAHLESLDAVIGSREREIEAERAALEAAERAAGAASQEARARIDAAVAELRLAESQLAETASLEQAEIASAAELRRTKAAADKQRAATRERQSASSYVRLDADRQAHDRLARIVTIEGEIAVLEVERTDAQARVEALDAELEQHRVRAPVDGVVGELAAIERGTWIERGQGLGAIVPEGELEIVARFPASDAVGRIKAGQPARLRLAGFPWAQYGTVEARVETVAREAVDPVAGDNHAGMIVVELAIEAVPATIILEHGLPGSVEVEVERTSPASLLLRAAGRRLSAGPGEAPR